MYYKNLLYAFFISIAFLGLVSSGLLAMEKEDVTPSKPIIKKKKSTQKEPQNFIERDIAILKEIIQKHKGNPYAYDSGYEQLGDFLLEFAQKHEKLGQPENLSAVIELYKKDKSDGLLNAPRITWFALQVSMALTQPETSKKKYMSASTKVLEDLQKCHIDYPQWLIDFKMLEEHEDHANNYLFKLLKLSHRFFLPVAVYEGSGNFSLRDYLKATSSGVFLFGLDPIKGSGHIIHGGIFRSTVEKTLHDMIHYYQQWFATYDKKITQDDDLITKYTWYAQIWKKMAEVIDAVLEKENTLSEMEKAQLETFSFLMMHEGVYTIPSVLKDFDKGALVDVVRKAATALKEDLIPKLSKPNNKDKFYEKRAMENMCERHPGCEFKSVIKVKDDEEEAYKTYIDYLAIEGNNKQWEIKMWVTGLENYEHWKTFYRDLGYILIKQKLWTPSTTKLGTTYDIGKVKNVIDQMHKWLMKVTEPNGKLYHHFSKITFSESSKFLEPKQILLLQSSIEF